jgi:hypothetical protein
MTELVLVALATLTSWEAARRMLPYRLPALVSMAVLFGLALVLIDFAPAHILLALAVTGALLLLAMVVTFEAVDHWGPLAHAVWLRITGRRTTTAKDNTDPGPKRRIPKLPV